MIFSLTGNDQRRPRLIDQDGVDFVDNGEIQAALNALATRINHVVAQIVETEFVVGAVGDVGSVGCLFRLVIHLRQIDAYGQPEKTVQTPHPFSVATGQVIVNRDDMDALAGDGIQVGRQGTDQRLAFTGAHFGNLAVMQHHAAHQLHVEMAHAEFALASFANHCKGFRQQVIKRFAIGVALTEFIRLGTQLLIAKSLQRRLKRIDAANG